MEAGYNGLSRLARLPSLSFLFDFGVANVDFVILVQIVSADFGSISSFFLDASDLNVTERCNTFLL